MLVPREGDDSSSTGGSSGDSRYPTDDIVSAQSGVVRSSTRPASAPLPLVSEHRDANDVSNLHSILPFVVCALNNDESIQLARWRL